jgi:hypothetical protein
MIDLQKNNCEKMKHKLFAALFTVVAFLNTINAQIADPKVDQTNAWITYTGNHKISEKWGVHTEFQWRRNHFLKDPMQNLLRLGIDYSANNNITISGGWCYVDSYEYGELGNADQATKYNQFRFNEQRIWEQLGIKHESIGRFQFDSRFRLEQRWIANLVSDGSGGYVRPDAAYIDAHPGTEDWRYRQRVRYRFRVQAPLSRAEMKDNTLFVAVADEIFANFGKQVTANVFDQNRLVVTLGWRFNKDFNIQAGYQNQFIVKANGKAKENNHTLITAITYNLDFTKAIKRL